MRNGVMFDVVAKSAGISITSMEIDVSNGTAAQVWTKAGGHFGFETNASSWTRIAGKVRDRFYPWASTGTVTNLHFVVNLITYAV